MKIRELIKRLLDENPDDAVYFQMEHHSGNMGHQHDVSRIRKSNFLNEIVIEIKDEYVPSDR